MAGACQPCRTVGRGPGPAAQRVLVSPCWADLLGVALGWSGCGAGSDDGDAHGNDGSGTIPTMGRGTSFVTIFRMVWATSKSATVGH